jgi:hypothetical protein
MLGYSPAWALGDAGELAVFPDLPGIESITVLVDHDHSGAGQRAALKCSSRWTDAGREVFRLVPRNAGADINDLGHLLRDRAVKRSPKSAVAQVDHEALQCRASVTHRPQVRSSSRSPPDIASSQNVSISSAGIPARRKALIT